MKILFIGAHADDIEIGCGGILLKLIKKNKVFNFIATDSEYKNENGKIIRTVEDAKNDVLRCYKGKKVVNIFGNLKVLNLQNNEKTRTELLKLKNKITPDVVFIPWNNDLHPDHKNLSEASLYVFKDIDNIIMYRSNWYNSPVNLKKNLILDISTEFKNKLKLVSSFRSEIKRTKSIWLEKIKQESLLNGQMINCKYAESFEAVKISSSFRT